MYRRKTNSSSNLPRYTGKNSLKLDRYMVIQIMDQKGMRQRDLADILGVRQSAVSRMLSADKRVKVETARRLSEALDVPVSVIIIRGV